LAVDDRRLQEEIDGRKRKESWLRWLPACFCRWAWHDILCQVIGCLFLLPTGLVTWLFPLTTFSDSSCSCLSISSAFPPRFSRSSPSCSCGLIQILITIFATGQPPFSPISHISRPRLNIRFCSQLYQSSTPTVRNLRETPLLHQARCSVADSHPIAPICDVYAFLYFFRHSYLCALHMCLDPTPLRKK